MTLAEGSPPAYHLHILTNERTKAIQLKPASTPVPLSWKKLGTSSFSIASVPLPPLEEGTSHRIKYGAKSFTFFIPAMNEHVKLVIAGDLMRHSKKHFREMAELAGSFRPNFAIFGGDLAYSIENEKKWIRFIFALSSSFRNPDGDLIPFCTACGNHDVHPKKNNLFFDFFPEMKNRTYYSFVFPKLCSFNILDSGHFSKIEGEQTAWLSKTLENQQYIPLRFSIYHVPAYPAVSRFQSEKSQKIRECWCPLFEKFGLAASFEHHGHGYKRTKKINGVTYFGDGGFGLVTRKVKSPLKVPYLKKTVSKRHFFLVKVKEGQAEVTAINPEGRPFDKKSI